MKRSWVAVVITVLLGALAGVAIAGRPTPVDQTLIAAPPATAAATTTILSTAAITSTSGAPVVTSTPAASTTTLTTVARVDRSAVRVLVANAANRTGIASSTADLLIAAGFTDSTPKNALNVAAVSVVHARPGFEAAAAEVAATLGLAATSVRPLDAKALTTDDGSGDVIAVIGVDFPR